MIPNKTIAQSQILILTNNQKSLRHFQSFRLEYDSNLAQAKNIILASTLDVPGVLADPTPRVLVTENTESWITMKVFYSIGDFSLKYRIGDQVITNVIERLNSEKISMATTKIKIQKTNLLI